MPCIWYTPRRDLSLRRQNRLIIVVFLFSDSILCDNLDKHSLEIDRQPSLQLIGAHSQDLQPLLKFNIRVVMFVEDG